MNKKLASLLTILMMVLMANTVVAGNTNGGNAACDKENRDAIVVLSVKYAIPQNQFQLLHRIIEAKESEIWPGGSRTASPEGVLKLQVFVRQAAETLQKFYGDLQTTQAVVLARRRGLRITRSASWETVVNNITFMYLRTGVIPAYLILDLLPRGNTYNDAVNALTEWEVHYLPRLIGFNPTSITDSFFLKLLTYGYGPKYFEKEVDKQDLIINTAVETARQIFIDLPREYEKKKTSPPELYFATVYALTTGNFGKLFRTWAKLVKEKDSTKSVINTLALMSLGTWGWAHFKCHARYLETYARAALTFSTACRAARKLILMRATDADRTFGFPNMGSVLPVDEGGKTPSGGGLGGPGGGFSGPGGKGEVLEKF